MLSDKAIQALRPDPERPGTKHHDRYGLYHRWQGARRTFTIGAYPAMRLPDDCKQDESSSRPFVHIAQAWFEHQSASWSPRY